MVGKIKSENVIGCWYCLVHVKRIFETIKHKFPIPERTFLPCDWDIGVIKKKKTLAVFTPQGWFDLVRNRK